MKVKRQVEHGMVRLSEMEDGSTMLSVYVPTSEGMAWINTPYMDEDDLWRAIVKFFAKS